MSMYCILLITGHFSPPYDKVIDRYTKEIKKSHQLLTCSDKDQHRFWEITDGL